MKIGTRWLICIPFWIAAICLVVFRPFRPGGLSEWNGHLLLGGLLIALPLWILRPGGIPRSAAGCLMLGFMLYKFTPFVFALGGFATPAWWALLSGLFYMLVLTRTGINRRIASYILRVFPPTRLGMTLALVAMGFVLSGLVPSAIIRIAILMPITLSLIELLKLEDRSPNAAFLTLLAWTMAVIPGNGWYIGEGWFSLGRFTPKDVLLSGSGIYPIELTPKMAATITWGDWAQAMVVPFILLTGLLFLSLFITIRPSRFPSIETSGEEFKLGAMSRDEKISAVILGLSLIGLVISPWVGICPAAVCFAGVLFLFAFGVLRFLDVMGLNWDLLIFFGAVLCLGMAWWFSGGTKWLEPYVGPLIQSLASNIFVFVVVTLLCLLAIRFIDVNFGLCSAAVLLFFTPMLVDLGIHPLVVSCLASIAGMFFCLHYMNPMAVMGATLLEDRGWREGQMVKYGVGFVVSALITVVISVFYWKAIGILV